MYLNLIQIAESFGVSENVVEGWIRDEGLPHTPDRGVLLFDRAQVAQWAATRGLAAKAGFLAAENPALAAALQLGPLLRAGGIWRDVRGGGSAGGVRPRGDRVAGRDAARPPDARRSGSAPRAA